MPDATIQNLNTPYAPQVPSNPLAGYTGGGLGVGAANVGVTPQNIASSPAYQFRFGQGLEALQRSAASRGTLLTGGTLKDLTAFGQGLASTEYDNEWQRQFGLAGLNAGISEGNANRTLGGLTSLSSMGLNAAGGMYGAYGNYGAAGANAALTSGSAANYAAGTIGNTIGEWLARRNAGGVGSSGGAGYPWGGTYAGYPGDTPMLPGTPVYGSGGVNT